MSDETEVKQSKEVKAVLTASTHLFISIMAIVLVILVVMALVTSPNWYDVVLGREVLEKVYFICGGPVLVIVALFGLRQIKVSMSQLQLDKENAAIQHKRDSLKFTMEQIKFLKEIKHDLASSQLDHDDKDDLTYAANDCELFAISFMSGIADHKLALRSCALSFCELVDEIQAVIDCDPEHAHYKNTVDLYGVCGSLCLKKKDCLLKRNCLIRRLTALRYCQLHKGIFDLR